MKKESIICIGALSLIGSLSSCDENYWNDHELEGFETPEVTEVKTIDYTMTLTDYATLAANSTNKALAGTELANALKAVGTQGYFTEQISAREYIPALLSDPSFPYFTLSNGSAIKMTYKTAVGLPAAVGEGAASGSYVVTEEEYKAVWGSDNDYVNAFAPSHPASRSIPSILASAYPDAEEGAMVVATYQVSATDPVFNAPENPDEPGFEMSDVLGTAAKGDQVTVNGYVTAACNAGFMLADKGGAIFVYMGSSYDPATYAIGDQLTLTGDVSSYNKGLQIAGSSAEMEKTGHGEYTYPTAIDFTGAVLDEAITRADDALGMYGTMSGTVSVSGSNINIKVAGAETAQGSIYYATDEQKAALTDGAEVSVEGYFIAIAGKRYCNFVVVKVGSTMATANVMSRSVSIASTQESVMYRYSGGRWSADTQYSVLTHDDYQAMGQRYDNLTNEDPEILLPKYLSQKFPYAMADDQKMVVYTYYASSTSSRRCDLYTYNGSEWVADNGIVEETAQFVMTGGKWIYDPNVTITLPAGKGIEISTLYYQTCVDWVAANIDKPTGATYVTSYGNNEYYSGTSAYQGNVDVRASSARAQYAAGYEGMTDDEVVEAMKGRFLKEVLPAALGILNPDANTIPGVDVIYTVNFSVYNGTTTAYTAKYKVVSKATFEFIECDW